MKILFLSGVYAKENEPQVIETSKGFIDFAANQFQQKLLNGLDQNNCDYTVLSTPFIGAYPFSSTRIFFRGFQDHSRIQYLPFCNIWGIRNLSRASVLKKAVKDFAQDPSEEKLILAYSAHTPFLEAAVHAKKQDPKIRICLVVPDVPQFMNLNQNRNIIYDVAKKYDIRKMTGLMKQVDFFVLLTEPMTSLLPVGEKRYTVIEGIVPENTLQSNLAEREKLHKDPNLKHIVYTGTTNAKYGIQSLVKAFALLPEENYRLVICGSGDSDDFIREQAKQDPRILVMGQVPSDQAREWVLKADVLVNPRPNNEEYTKYSFPSKNIEYLSSGNPVVAYLLDGMKPLYQDFLLIPENDSSKAMAEAIGIAIREGKQKGDFPRYAEEITPAETIRRILNMYFETKND